MLDLLLAAACWLAPAVGTPAGSPARVPTPSWLGSQGSGSASAPRDVSVAALRERDLRVGFTELSADRARRALEAGLEEQDRWAALLALGAAGTPEDLAQLAHAARTGGLADRRVAILALGESKRGAVEALRALAADAVPGLDGALVVAHARAVERGVPGAEAAAAALVADMQGPYGELLRGLGALTSPAALPDTIPELRTYYRVRWEAARAYGLVDGKRWRDVQLDALAADPDFLDLFVLRAAVHRGAALDVDAVLELVRGNPSPPVLAAAMAVHPEAIRRLVEEEGWRPDAAGLTAILDGVPDGPARAEREAVLALLKGASRARPALAERALALSVRQGAKPPRSWLAKARKQLDDVAWSALFRAAGDRGDKAASSVVFEMLTAVPPRQRDSATAMAGWVALLRLGDARGREHVEALVAEGATPARQRLFEALREVCDARDGARLLAELARHVDLAPAEQRTVLLGLAEAGLATDHAPLRELLTDPESTTADRRVLVRALGDAAEPADLELLASLLPSPQVARGSDGLDVSTETTPAWSDSLDPDLAAALLWNRDPDAMRLLEAALYGEGFGASLLAGALWIDLTGARGVIAELAVAPALEPETARRVGYAVGRAGGFALLGRLREGRDERDPLLQGALLGASERQATEREQDGGAE